MLNPRHTSATTPSMNSSLRGASWSPLSPWYQPMMIAETNPPTYQRSATRYAMSGTIPRSTSWSKTSSTAHPAAAYETTIWTSRRSRRVRKKLTTRLMREGGKGTEDRMQDLNAQLK